MPEGSFDLHNLISPPWRTCPACGKDKFGVGLINGSHLMRRCRDCWHKQDYRLPKLRKQIIYLDQFVISNLAKLRNPAIKGHASVAADPFWRELHDLLFQLRQLQMICCPDSGSHEVESRISGFNAEYKKMYESLSGGISFNSFDSIESTQIGELARAWSEGREPESSFDPSGILSRDPNQWNERFYIVFGDNPFVSEARIRHIRVELHTNIARLFRDIWAKEKHSFEHWYELERTGFQGHLLKAAGKHKRERDEVAFSLKPGAEPSLEVLENMLPSFPEGIIESIGQIIQFTRDGAMRSREAQLELAKSFFLRNRIADAPFVKLQSLMFAAIAMLAVQGQKKPPDAGTTTDIDTVAHLLPYCDAMFMDNRCRSLLLNIPTALRPMESSRVFSLNIKAQFLDYLRSIRGGISAEHVQAIREVYGEGYLVGLPGVQKA